MKQKLQSVTGRFCGSALLTGTAMLFISMTIVNGGNYLFNLFLGRWLGPETFADLSLIVTLMLMVTFVTITFQLTAAKFAAAHTAAGAEAQLVQTERWLKRQAWIWGISMAAFVAGGAPLWQRFFHTASIWPFVILGLGLPVYLVQGVDRGILQGKTKFGRLAMSYQAEMWVRLGGGVLLVWAGGGVNGAVLAITLSFFATWFVARTGAAWFPFDWRPNSVQLGNFDHRTVVAFAGPVLVAQMGQILINNSDILIVKRFFSAGEAGAYAALALIGRIVFFATWSVVTTLFPIVAQRHERSERHRQLLHLGLALVGVVSAGIIAAAWFMPDLIVNILFGEAYLTIAPLLWLYAVATALYALANVVINYRLSANQGGGTYIGFVAGALQIGALSIFHDSLHQVVVAQIVLMSGLLFALLVWDGLLARGSLRQLQLVSELTRA